MRCPPVAQLLCGPGTTITRFRGIVLPSLEVDKFGAAWTHRGLSPQATCLALQCKDEGDVRPPLETEKDADAISCASRLGERLQHRHKQHAAYAGGRG